MEWLSSLLKTSSGKLLGGLLVVIVCLLAIYEIRNFVSSGAGASAEERTKVFICSQTGKAFKHELVLGEKLPVLSPYSGANTGYIAESCYWNADGTTKQEPTYVLLNQYIGKPDPTFCPDCGRLVRMQNPYPAPGAKPPPTREEYERMHAQSGN